MSLRVYAIVMQDSQAPKLPEGVRMQPLRELAAVTEEGDYTPRDVENSDIQRHFEIVEGLFDKDAVLPTPVGTIFRSLEVLQRWMDLHYVALSDALAWVHDRVAARVHMSSTEAGAESGMSPDDAAVATEVARSLRRRAVASVPLRSEQQPNMVSTAYLVERELWQEFADAIADEQERHQPLKIALTGPWPPYDFVRLQFGA
ncbi:MAG TPA: GvpL/GvpF family gas vesicle protein [Gemmatimonadaceae bacterium]|nr:GvpL/GvpF family gas vesicle protein [Gemmatimonadaceae bacterium]